MQPECICARPGFWRGRLSFSCPFRGWARFLDMAPVKLHLVQHGCWFSIKATGYGTSTGRKRQGACPLALDPPRPAGRARGPEARSGKLSRTRSEYKQKWGLLCRWPSPGLPHVASRAGPGVRIRMLQQSRGLRGISTCLQHDNSEVARA